MFELSVAFKYLLPRRRQLSVSIISLISILVIALVVWLVVVFFSVTHGLERSWTQKLTALTAPLRIVPTAAYYQSYYYLIDAHSAASDYRLRTIGEKIASDTYDDPYDPVFDGELPEGFPKPDLDSNGKLKNLVNKVMEGIKSQGILASDFEITASQLQLQVEANLKTSILNQTLYLGSYDPQNTTLPQTLLPLSLKDIKNFIKYTYKIHYNELSLATYVLNKFLLRKNMDQLPDILAAHPEIGEPILLPKNFRKSNALVGDQGNLTYYAPTLSAVHEQYIPVFVAGFYDPGILPTGGKFGLANRDTVSLIQSNYTDNSTITNGIYVRFNEPERADGIKKALTDKLKRDGIEKYWQIETYREYEFTKDILQQLRSERNLWKLLATVIIIVACSNIISMLIILVNDKKIEIGILRAMGATPASISIIFGICGMTMGMVGSLIGMGAAYLTLQNLQVLVDFIGRVQGYEMFNPVFYGDSLPNQISFEAVFFVVLTTSAVSLLAGLIPAIKASLLRPTTILRAE